MNACTSDLLNKYPYDVTNLWLERRNIIGVLDLGAFSKLTNLNCSYNKIVQLCNLPNCLIELNCSHNQIVQLDNLPDSLTTIKCSHNRMMDLEKLPNSLVYLDCSENKITKLNNIPKSAKNIHM
jgi:Leucine-rich repeat (LRR) protein